MALDGREGLKGQDGEPAREQKVALRANSWPQGNTWDRNTFLRTRLRSRRRRADNAPSGAERRPRLLLLAVLAGVVGGAGSARSQQTPVIVDTDIGTFADDTLALAQALSARELDVRMVVTTSGDAAFRARVAAKQLRLSGRADIPVGIGVSLPRLHPREPLQAFAADEDLSAHRGGWHADGPAAAARMIMTSGREDWVIVVLGPSSSVAAMLKVEPAVAQRARVTVMGASVCGGVRLPWNATTPRAATNERQDVAAARAVGAAAWRRPPEYAGVCMCVVCVCVSLCVCAPAIMCECMRGVRVREPCVTMPAIHCATHESIHTQIHTHTHTHRRRS